MVCDRIIEWQHTNVKLRRSYTLPFKRLWRLLYMYQTATQHQHKQLSHTQASPPCSLCNTQVHDPPHTPIHLHTCAHTADSSGIKDEPYSGTTFRLDAW